MMARNSRPVPATEASASGSADPARTAGPGRPKDLGKRAAILEAAKRMFTTHGFAGVSMDQIAADAGVSKLTVYSHFGDKEALFIAAVKSHCEQGLPSALFECRPEASLRDRLLEIGRAFFAMISCAEGIAGHRMLCSPQLAGTALSDLFWDAGPERCHVGLVSLLERHIASGELRIDDLRRASSQFFTLIKGEPHALLVLGCKRANGWDIEAHLAASVDLFLRAYAVPGHGDTRAIADAAGSSLPSR